ncbi:MAG: hypothetical protein VW268_06015 [Rhodospirillaceae bacterium]
MIGQLDIVVVVIAAIAVAGFFLPAVTGNRIWRTTVTPLASIIGSGFLIVGPLLGKIVGAWAPAAMAARG